MTQGQQPQGVLNIEHINAESYGFFPHRETTQ